MARVARLIFHATPLLVTPVARFADERLIVALRVLVASVNDRRMVAPTQTLTDLHTAQAASLRSERFIDDPVTRRHDPSCPLSAFNLRFRYAVFGAYVSHDLLKVPGVRRCGHAAPVYSCENVSRFACFILCLSSFVLWLRV